MMLYNKIIHISYQQLKGMEENLKCQYRRGAMALLQLNGSLIKAREKQERGLLLDQKS